MTGKDWIESVTDTLQAKIAKLERDEERLQTLRADVITTKAIMYDADKVQTSVSDDKVMQKYALMDEISRRMFKEMEDYNIFRASAIQRLHKLVKNPTLADCLERRHIDFLTVTQIAQIEGVTEICIKKRFNKAYNLLNSIYVLEKYRKCSEKVDSIPQNVVV